MHCIHRRILKKRGLGILRDGDTYQCPKYTKMLGDKKIEYNHNIKICATNGAYNENHCPFFHK